ncbi:S24 family peptidase [Thiorhodococcus minor]|uniref:S24 family peptidase n=1 Tax=Thiorhodococcus minor TaxID=57489 RepID=A0A6M0JW39_9GAMM|nr:S24 family peptidase [Thiorhodococcus minor]NEV61756.1 S24 family peptidase [Thiorhodococcus minor]
MSKFELEGSGCSLHEPYALQVLGNEMEPEFPDRCVVIIEPTDHCPSHGFVFAEVEGVRWFRQYVRDETGRERLVALNALYPDIELNGLEWSVLGVIIQRNIRRQVKHYDYADQPSSGTAAQITDLTSQ